MSYTTQVKQEIVNNELHDCCIKAKLSAFILMNSTLNFTLEGMSITIKSENATTARRIYTLVKNRYQVDLQISVLQKMVLKKNKVYLIKIKNKAAEILEDLQILTDEGLRRYPKMDMVEKECCARAYLAGAFLASGSVNSPSKSNYHLEIACIHEETAKFIQNIMISFQMNAKHIKRRNQEVVYLKASDQIGDFLRYIGASDSLFTFEDSRIQRDFINSFTRLDNCELANEMKSMAAGKKQLEDIEWIETYKGISTLPVKLQRAAQARMALPEASLNELCDYCEEEFQETISKSGMKHRLAKIKEIAKEIAEKYRSE